MITAKTNTKRFIQSYILLAGKPWPITKIRLIKHLPLTSPSIKEVNIQNFDSKFQ